MAGRPREDRTARAGSADAPPPRGPSSSGEAVGAADRPWFSAPLGVWLLGLYFAINGIVLALTRSGTSYDGAEQLLYTQYWDWGYGRSQPPLYSWLLHGLHTLAGVSIATENLLKFGLLTSACWLAYALARASGLGRRAGAAAAFALFLIPEVGWESQRNYSHSVLLVVTVLAFALVLVRLRADRSWTGYALLGAAAAAAILSKYNAVFVVAALLGADAALAGRGSLVRDRRIGLAGVVAVGLLLPHGLWMAAHVDAVVALSGKLALHPDRGSALVRRLAGLGHLAIALLAVLGPMIAVAAIAFARLRRRPDPTGAPADVRILALGLAIGLGLTVLAMIVSGVGKVEPRWMVPWAVLAPIVILGSSPAGPVRQAVASALAVGGTVAALVVAPILWINGTLLGGRTQFDYDGLASDMAKAVGPARTVVFSDYALYSNLRLADPDLTVIHAFIPADRFLVLPPAVAVWDGSTEPDPALQEELADLGLKADLAAARDLTLRSVWTDEERAVRVAPLGPVLP